MVNAHYYFNKFGSFTEGGDYTGGRGPGAESRSQDQVSVDQDKKGDKRK